MAVPTENVDLVGQQSSGDAGKFSVSQATTGTKIWHFQRTFQHYIESDTNFPGLVTDVPNKKATFSEGWHWIPYNNLRASITPRDWKALTVNSRLMRVKSMGFKVHNCQTIAQQAKSNTSAADLTAQFISAPFYMYGVDRGRLTQDLIWGSEDANTKARNSVNDHLTVAWPESFAAGQLKKVVWNLGPNYIESLGLNPAGDAVQEAVTSRGSVNTLNGFFDLTFERSGDFSHTWHGHAEADDRWYAIGKYTSLPQSDGTIKPVRLINTIDATTEIGQIEYNAGTDVNRNYQGAPEPCYVKLPPIFQKLGPMIINASMFITYHCTLETLPQPSASFLTLNQGVPIIGQETSYNLATPAKWNFNRERNIYQWQAGYTYKAQPNTRRSAIASRSTPYSRGKHGYFSFSYYSIYVTR